MPISTAFTTQELNDQVKFKDEEISFFASKIIELDGSSGQTKDLIKAIDNSLLDDIEAVNSKLRDVRSAYQDRIDEGCKSDLFWRITGVEIVGESVYKYTLKCTRLSQNYEKVYFGRTTPYADFEKDYYKAFKIPLPPLDDGLSIYYVSNNTQLVQIPQYSGSDIFGTPTVGVSSFPSISGISSFRGDDKPTYATLSDNLYGIKYYDEPYSKDIGDTFVCSFPGKISVGSTILTALSDSTYGGLTELEVGQIITSSKDGVFSAGYNTIVGIATTPGNADPDVPSSPASASAGITTNTFKLSSITILNGGTGFTTTPSVTIGAPNAITAIGTAIVSSAGSITSATITNSGTGYTQAPPVYFSTPGSFKATGIGSTGALGIVTSVSILNAGFGYTLAPTITFANPPTIGVGIGSTALGVAFISTSAGGIVTGISVTFPGLGYTTSPIVTFSNPGIHTAVGITTLGTGVNAGIVTGIIVGTGLTNTGFGYTTSTPITVTIGEPLKIQAVGIANVSSASTISSITLSEVGAGYTSAPSVAIEDPALQVVNIIILENPAVTEALAPEADGTLVDFTASIAATGVVDLLNINTLSVKFNKGTFSPQTIGIMTSGKVGIGVSIKYDNSGINSGKESWKPEFAHPRINIKGGKDIPAIEEPKVGAGKIYYKDGLDFYPIKTPGDPNSEASVGETIEVLINPNSFLPSGFGGVYSSLSGFIESCPSCSASVTTNLNNAIAAANAAESQFASNSSTLNAKISAANLLRKQKNEKQLQIWGYRSMMGQLLVQKEEYQNILTLFDDPTIKQIFSS